MAATTTTGIPPPLPRDLLPPLLACLPTAFVSPHPPPALLPLLSPILRQRLTLLSGNTSSGNGGWLSLLSWEPARAKKLGKHLEGIQFEAHPVSGELELEDVDTIGYRRLDAETLQARLEVDEFDLLPVFVWVEHDEQNEGTGRGWKVAELRVLEDKEDGSVWTSSLAAADEAHTAKSAGGVSGTAAVSAAGAGPRPAYQAPSAMAEENLNDDDDDDGDDYWNMYDATPGRTPARTPAKRSPAPVQHSSFSSSQQQQQQGPQIGPTKEELEYFARYASEVQPALDSHDPDEEIEEAGQSTLTGDTLTRAVNPTQTSLYAADDAQSQPQSLKRREHNAEDDDDDDDEKDDIEAPRATSPSSSSSVERLERLAALQQEERERDDDAVHGGSSRSFGAAETGVRQFISTEIKSLYRLAKSVGIGRDEFGEMVGREVSVLGFMDED